MVSERRKQAIKQKAISIQKEKAKLEDKEQKEYEDALTSCKLLSDRIGEIIDTANYIIKSGIELPTTQVLKKHGYSSGLFAEGFYHLTGFMGKGEETPIKGVGFINSGCYGGSDFYTDGKKFLVIPKKDKSQKRTADRYSLEKFLSEFPKFEKAFYDWVDSGMNE